MTELERRIRAEIDGFCISDWCAEKGRAALTAVLDLHGSGEDHMCIKDIAGYSVQAWYRPDEDCPTVVAIACGLGLIDNEEEDGRKLTP